MSKVVLSEAMETFFEYFAKYDGQEVTLTAEEVTGFASAFGEMADYALQLEIAADARCSAARAGIAASAINVGGNVILFPILPRPQPAA